ncbi:MAG: type II toxin-antitoxin system antitoxin SocA domain-containing protein [Bacteroidota bacterium]
MYSAVQIAVAFVNKGIAEGNYVTQMKLQKLVYFAHGYHLATNNQPLIREEIQAWEFGPVIPSIYHAFKLYGSDVIADLKYASVSPSDLSIRLSASALETINYTWKALSGVSAAKLSAWTHQNGSPWQNVYNPGVRDIRIDQEEIQKYFKIFLQPA